MNRRPMFYQELRPLRPRRPFPVLGVLAFLGCVAFGYLVLSLAFALTAPAGGVPW
jgi:hypothetical protein